MSQLPNQSRFAAVTPTPEQIKNDKNRQKVSIATTLGMLGGVYFAYKRKSSVWGYAGYGFLFSFVAGRVARMFFPVNWVQTAFPSRPDGGVVYTAVPSPELSATQETYEQSLENQ
jgi:hypothetical protein